MKTSNWDFRFYEDKCYTKISLFSFIRVLQNTQDYKKILHLNDLNLEHSIL